MVGMKVRMAMLTNITEWMQMEIPGQSVHTFVALLQEVDTEITSGESIVWMGYPEIPKHVLEDIKVGMFVIDASWVPPPPTVIM